MAKFSSRLANWFYRVMGKANGPMIDAGIRQPFPKSVSHKLCSGSILGQLALLRRTASVVSCKLLLVKTQEVCGFHSRMRILLSRQ